MTTAEWPRLDLIIPVYNEGASILRTLQSVARELTAPVHALVCRDREGAMPAICGNGDALGKSASAESRRIARAPGRVCPG